MTRKDNTKKYNQIWPDISQKFLSLNVEVDEQADKISLCVSESAQHTTHTSHMQQHTG